MSLSFWRLKTEEELTMKDIKGKKINKRIIAIITIFGMLEWRKNKIIYIYSRILSMKSSCNSGYFIV